MPSGKPTRKRSGTSGSGQPEVTKLNSVRKVFLGKVRNFSPTKISSFTVGVDLHVQRWFGLIASTDLSPRDVLLFLEMHVKLTVLH